MLLVLIVLLSSVRSIRAFDKDDLLVVSVATNETDGYHRFIRSLQIYGYKYEIYGLSQIWKGGNIKYTTGGGQKINLLRENLVRYKDDKKKIILFTDAYDVIFTKEPKFILEKFETFEPARVVFGAEDSCWPVKNLENEYSFVESNEKRFLNSGGFIGYANDIYEMISSREKIDDNEDDQLFYTKLFLNDTTRTKWSIALDKKAEIFMNLNGAIDEITMLTNEDEIYVHNTRTDSAPIVIHGNGPSKKMLNYLSNYLARTWSLNTGCLFCKENLIDVTDITDFQKWPIVYMVLFIEFPTPFLEEYFDKITKITYPKQRIGIFVHNQVEYHRKLTEKYLTKFKQDEYKFVKYLNIDDDITEGEARQQAINECQEDKCDYLFVIDSIVHIDHDNTLIELMRYNKTIVAPMLARPGTARTNFWGDYSHDGYYKHSPDYLEIVNYNKIGLFHVPHVAHCYLINGTLLQRFTPEYIDATIDPDIKFSQSLRDADHFTYVSNENEYGHLIDPDNFDISLTQSELYEIFNNIRDWETRYIHPDYYKLLDSDTVIEQPCPDVYWFPLVTDEFTQSIINIMETSNLWSGSRHYDNRLGSGYENVPTDDIHLTQVNFNEHWLFILRNIIQPIQRKVFTGYYSDPIRALLNFVVRYMPEYQNKLRPHHDVSTYTINLALNEADKDYEGGGCRFIRYNCTLRALRRGWVLMHPGRLTHLHEGLPTTKGKRYIMVSFIDP